MRKRILFIALAIFCCSKLIPQSGVRILFDAKKAETAGNADWIIDADSWNLVWNPNATLTGPGNKSNAQQFPTPSQTLITASTPETFWTGAISYWGVDCVKRGYQVETLTYSTSITYGNPGNPQDLSNYKVYIVDEPNILFTAAEKTAMMQFVQNGGSLFLISDHINSDRNGDGYDSPVIWNDFITNNGVLNNGLGFSFDLVNFSQTSFNIAASPSDSIIHGPMGNVTQVKWSNGTSLTLNPSQNPSVKGVIYTTGTTPGNTNVMCAYARVGSGKVAAIGDSSPTDDATGNPNSTLYNGYITDAAGNHQKLLMNITIWLAGGSVTGIKENNESSPFNIYPNPTNEDIIVNLNSSQESYTLKVFDMLGNIVITEKISSTTKLNLGAISNGVYFIALTDMKNNTTVKKFIKNDF